MKFKFKNLGPIDEACLELGDLTIIAGRNNTGKSYVAYSIYGFLRDFAELVVERSSERGDYDLLSPRTELSIEHTIGQLLSGNQVSTPMTKDDLDSDKMYLVKQVAQAYSHSKLDGLFNSTVGTFKDTSVDVKADEFHFGYAPLEFVLDSGYELVIKHETDTLKIVLDRNGSAGINDALVRNNYHTLEAWLPYMYSHFLLQGDFLSDVTVRCFTSVRLAISLFHKELESSRRLAVRRLQQDERTIEDSEGALWIRADSVSSASRYVLPINDEIDFIKNIPDDDHSPKEFSRQDELHDIEEMMEGHYEKHKQDFYFVLSEKEGERFRIPLHLASSSVAELTNLYFLFRNSSGHHNQILVIDEPESHLDTANQIRLARLLARLVNSGIRVLVTTHSDYIVKEINNLIMLNEPFVDKEQTVKHLGYRENECLDPSSVKAYIAEERSLTPCIPDRLGVDMPVFDKTINDINRVADDLYARLLANDEEN